VKKTKFDIIRKKATSFKVAKRCHKPNGTRKQKNSNVGGGKSKKAGGKRTARNGRCCKRPEKIMEKQGKLKRKRGDSNQERGKVP